MTGDANRLRLVGELSPGRVEDLGDDDLMLLANAGQQDAFEVLVGRHQAFVYGLTARFLGDRGLARDVTQDVFLALWAERERYRARGKLRSYLAAVAVHRCHHLMRQRRTHSDKLPMLQTDGAAATSTGELPLAQLVERERTREVRRALTQLPEKCRQVVILRFTHELSMDEIAETTGMPVGTVKSHLFRGVKRLHGLLQRDSR